MNNLEYRLTEINRKTYKKLKVRHKRISSHLQI